MTPLPAGGLYAITDAQFAGAGGLAPAVAAVLRGGVAVVQYRDKGADTARREAEARALLALCRRHGVPLVINDDVALAARIGADGVHLGRADATVATARAALGPDAIVGVSCYDDPARALEAQAEGASYVAFGRFFPSRTKPGATPASVERLRAARPLLGVPVAAIGGITAENGPALVAAGADFLAVVHALFAVPDPEAAARSFAPLFAGARRHPSLSEPATEPCNDPIP